MRLAYRTVWISDTHLGSRSAQAGELAEFLKHIECERLYLVGDFIDFWRLRSRPYWPASHNDVVRRLLTLIKRGTTIIYVPGNHDETARQYADTHFAGMEIHLETVHTTTDGRRLLITHGDIYDLVVKHSRLLAMIGGAAYEWLIRMNRPYNWCRDRLGLPRASLSQAIKLKVKSACNFVSAFEQTLAGEAISRGLDGVVCGHVHKPEIRRGDVDYYNCGDWVESCTALVEHEDGRMQLLHYREAPGIAARVAEPRRPGQPKASETTEPADAAAPDGPTA